VNAKALRRHPWERRGRETRSFPEKGGKKIASPGGIITEFRRGKINELVPPFYASIPMGKKRKKENLLFLLQEAAGTGSHGRETRMKANPPFPPQTARVGLEMFTCRKKKSPWRRDDSFRRRTPKRETRALSDRKKKRKVPRVPLMRQKDGGGGVQRQKGPAIAPAVNARGEENKRGNLSFGKERKRGGKVLGGELGGKAANPCR